MPDDARRPSNGPYSPPSQCIASRRRPVAPAGLDKAALKRGRLALAMGGPRLRSSTRLGAPTADLRPLKSPAWRALATTLLRLRAQGLVALASGDVAEARAFLERASEAGDARALLVLGDTYDPTTLARLGAIGIKGDVARARDYYARASEAGLAAASPRVASAEIAQ